MKLRIGDMFLIGYLVVTCFMAAASLVDDFLEMRNGFSVSHTSDWLAPLFLLWIPISIPIVVLAVRSRRIAVAILAAGMMFYVVCSIAIVVAFRYMDPKGFRSVAAENKAPAAFVYFDLAVEPIILIGGLILLVRYRHRPRKKNDERLVRLDDG